LVIFPSLAPDVSHHSRLIECFGLLMLFSIRSSDVTARWSTVVVYQMQYVEMKMDELASESRLDDG
jgi:hypothetical protein